ncbi:PP2C family serine/threonine-protein phosphatase [Hyphomicrobium sp. CS1BSMeth3]|uniref:PP2C family protein-serine/threonine phosphatase n=1 Tax=Hyphomicrobium sp. CS1BSMeth3 TaxID=1892844 RepID=UPI000931BD55|nr:PP2C family serine/threonine-protein phosphatase [Hyphomicrobium sp. CS1BSMeth3]
MIELDIAEAQTIGTRAEQQDATAIVRIGDAGDAVLLVLADGLGGHANGAEAARLVAETFRERVPGGGFRKPEDRRRALDETIQEVNQRILAASNPADGERSMGSTAVAAIVAEGRLRWISVGDSHLYVWRRGRLAKLNADHSQAGIMIRQGYATDHPAVLNARSLLASALTGSSIEEIDAPVDDLALARDDVVLLASDGLDGLNGTEIARIIGETFASGAEAIANALIAAVIAHRLQRQDNATVVVARVLGSGAPAHNDDPLPDSVPTPAAVGDYSGAGHGWSLTVGAAVLLAILAGVIMTQI